MPSLMGIQVVTSEYLTEQQTTTERLTWWQRLRSWPWRPWIATVQVTRTVPSKQALMLDGRMVVHPAMLTELHRVLDETPYRAKGGMRQGL